MTTVTLDFETYSEADLIKVGAWPYSEHPSTDIICLSWGVDDEEPDLWVPEMGSLPKRLVHLIVNECALVEAHNAQFERAIWKNVGVRLYKFPPVFETQWRCTLAACAHRALPLKLEKVCEVLALPVQKDMEGNRAMRRISRPDPKMGERIYDFDLEQKTYAYCLDDERAERGLHHVVGDLPAPELAVWQLNQRVQERGLQIDQELCRAAIAVAHTLEQRLLPELANITKGDVTTVGQRDRVLEWLGRRGVQLPDLTKDTVTAAVTEELRERDPDAHRLLEIRQTLGKASHKKYGKALACVCADGRVRGATQYHGATTGREAGRLVQPQNFRRPVYFGEGEEIEVLAEAIKTRDPDLIEIVAGCDVMEALADGVRGIVVAGKGNELCAGDYSAIEAVVTAALAGEQSKLDVFRRGDDPYCWFAEKVVGHPVTKKEHPKIRQEVGKPGELAYGFAGGVGAWRKFDTSDRFEDAEVEKFRDVWRAAHPRVVHMWDALDWCAMQAVLYPGEVFRFLGPGNEPSQGLAYTMRGDFLLCQLPSGRRLHYFRPRVRNTLMPWTDHNGDPVYKPQVWYWTMTEGRWQFVKGWRGQWTENNVQAVARDLMVTGMFSAERAQFPVVLTIHDEVVTEPSRIMHADPEEFANVLVRNRPNYARPWPVSAGAWVGQRYRKE